MSPESLFKRSSGYVHIRLALEEWTELPGLKTQEWKTLVQLLTATCEGRGGAIYEASHNGTDLYLLLRLDLSASVDSVVESLGRQMEDPFWRPFIQPERFAWVGGYHAASVRPGDKLSSQSLEHPMRRWKREHMERSLGRALEHPWHDALTPEAVGIEFVACGPCPTVENGDRFDLLYHQREGRKAEKEEGRAATHLNARLRIPGILRTFESIGWSNDFELPSLVFSIPSALLADAPAEIEVWWATDSRKFVGSVPCRELERRPISWMLRGDPSPKPVE